MTEIPSEMDAPAVHDPGPSTEHGQPAPVDKPRRHWRVTKAALEQRIAELEYLCEARATYGAKVTECYRDLDKLQTAARKGWDEAVWWGRALAALALAGWAAFAVAVVW